MTPNLVTVSPSQTVRNSSDAGRSRWSALVILGLAIALLLPAVYWMAKPFVTAFVLAAILAVVLEPVQKRASRRIKRSSLAALLTTLVGIGPILGIVLVAGIIIEHQIKSGVLSSILSASERLTSSVSIDRYAVIEKAVAELSQFGGALFTTCMSMLFLYILLLHGPSWLLQLTSMIPLDRAVTNRILTTANDAIVANVDGIVAVAAAEGFLFGLVFWIAGVGLPVMWGAVGGLATLIPIVGGLAVWLPMAAMLAIHGAYAKALIVGIGCLVAQTAVSTLVRPKVVGSRVSQPPLLIALSVLGGTEAFGALGILVGPVIVSVLAGLVREFRIQLLPADR